MSAPCGTLCQATLAPDLPVGWPRLCDASITVRLFPLPSPASHAFLSQILISKHLATPIPLQHMLLENPSRDTPLLALTATTLKYIKSRAALQCKLRRCLAAQRQVTQSRSPSRCFPVSWPIATGKATGIALQDVKQGKLHGVG